MVVQHQALPNNDGRLLAANQRGHTERRDHQELYQRADAHECLIDACDASGMPVERWVEINWLTSDPAVWRAQVDQVDKLSLLDPALKEKLLSLAVTGH
jgi:hypothetical protein